MMNRDKFYDAFMETAPEPEPAAADMEELEDPPVKDTYTRAEVEELINKKLEEITKGELNNGSNSEEGTADEAGNE